MVGICCRSPETALFVILSPSERCSRFARTKKLESHLAGLRTGFAKNLVHVGGDDSAILFSLMSPINRGRR